MRDSNEFPIQIEGVSEFFCKNIKSFCQLNIQETVSINSIDGIEHILKVSVSVEKLKLNTCKTISGVNFEGQVFTGSKLSVEGKVKFIISYVSKSESSDLLIEELNIPFCSYIILEDKSAMHLNYDAVCYIEDIYVKLKSRRKIFYNIAICIHAEPISSH